MTLEDYQFAAAATAIYPDQNALLEKLDREAPLPIYPALKLAGEAGEIAQKVGKAIRDGVGDYSQFRLDIASELGDVLWYVSAIARDLGLSLEQIGEGNLVKLASRKQRGVISGSGDNR